MLEHSNLVRLNATYDVDIEWRGFQLHPEIPPGGASLEQLFGRRADGLRRRVEAIAADFGVELSAPERAPSTIAPLAATELARDAGALKPFRDFLMTAYWRDGRDIESNETLGAAARHSGLNVDEIVSAASDPAYVGRVEQTRENAHRANVSAIPTLIVRGFPIVGCQRWETYERVADKLELTRL